MPWPIPSTQVTLEVSIIMKIPCLITMGCEKYILFVSILIKKDLLWLSPQANAGGKFYPFRTKQQILTLRNFGLNY